MDQESALFAKVAALSKSFSNIGFDARDRCSGRDVEPFLPNYKAVVAELKGVLPHLFGDIPEIEIPRSIGQGQHGPIYEARTIRPLINNLDYILELRANMRIGEKREAKAKEDRIFISHGRSPEWYKVLMYLEKDLAYMTLELAQEPNIGRTVLQKLNEESERCKVAVIVMTGDDIMNDTQIRARENVMHEIGFFQGKYGLQNVILLHEEGVNIPSNIHGLVYIPFPKDTVQATFGALRRELKVIMA